MTKRKITEMDRLVAGNIRRLRELYGFDRRALEEKAGIAYGILDQIEALHKPAGKTIQMRIARGLGCSVGELYKDKSPMVKESTTRSLTSRQKRLLSMAEHLTDKELEEVINYIMWLQAKRG
ncbi:MAG: hypothetical protein HZA12_01880 [Nitrospirae bacterium]|nr:hypothetical protein [Nitrospirota bacterium]